MKCTDFSLCACLVSCGFKNKEFRVTSNLYLGFYQAGWAHGPLAYLGRPKTFLKPVFEHDLRNML
ncbi:hypothetical protein Hanom_Chr17g01559661 [Helianthus anomalus]